MKEEGVEGREVEGRRERKRKNERERENENARSISRLRRVRA